MKTPPATLAAVALSATNSLSAAPVLKATLAYPATVTAAKAKAKLQEKTHTETGAILKYQEWQPDRS